MVLIAATGFAAWWRARNGQIRDPGGHVQQLGAGDVGLPMGERATLVQVSSAFCQPCRATRAMLTAVADAEPGVVHVEIDAESNLDLVRRLNVVRTPTTIVVDSAGRIVRRASGVPRADQVRAVLAGLTDTI
jgi:thioredoxin-like negative regulator of GroEL